MDSEDVIDIIFELCITMLPFHEYFANIVRYNNEGPTKYIPVDIRKTHQIISAYVLRWPTVFEAISADRMEPGNPKYVWKITGKDQILAE